MRTAAAMVVLAGLSLGGVQVDVGGGIYPRFMVDAQKSSFFLMGAEANVRAQVTSRTRDILTAAVQVAAGSAMQGWTRGFHFGEAYVLVPTGLRLPTVLIGQAVIPFGLMADYDIHTQIVQTSFARSLGLRLDPGIGVLGSLGPADYWLWVSNGNGPYVMDNDVDKVITTRIAPTFLLGDAEVTAGLSGLIGSLPHWSLDSLSAMMSGPRAYAKKYRLGLDNTTDWGPLTLRLEGIIGKDSTFSHPAVFGYYGEARYSFARWIEALGKYDGWHAGVGSARNLGVGLNLSHPDVSMVNFQVVYQVDFLDTGASNEQNWSVVSQVAVSF
jgi:hypothetical protein